MNVREILSDPSYGPLKSFVLERTGLHYFADKDEDLAARLARRFGPLEVPDCAAYLQRLRTGKAGREEMDRLIGELTIGETYFFRQPEHFDFLRKRIIPYLIESNSSKRQIRIWSAGCATGAEPYSIAILLALEFEQRLAGWDVSILATDINLDFLARARAAVFAEWALRETPAELRSRCFTRRDNQWTLRPEFRSRVHFQNHNLAESYELPDGADCFDLIFCRNVLIYFSKETSRKVVERFRKHLAEEGWLLVGYAEPSAELFESFETVSYPGVTAYRRRPLEKKSMGWLPGSDLSDPPAIWNLPPITERPAGTDAFPSQLPLPAQMLPQAIADSAAPQTRRLPSVEEARMLADTGRWGEARQVVNHIIAADPLNPVAHFTMGLILDHTGLVSDSRESFHRAIYLDREFALAHYYLGVSFKLKHDHPLARKAFRNVLAILGDRRSDEPVPQGDGMTSGELRELSQMHMELLVQ